MFIKPRTLILLILVLSPLSRASVTSALINKALDSQQKLDLDTTLPDAIQQIEKQTGVRIEADPAVWELLPWGEQTSIKAKIENQTLGKELTAITQKLGLDYVLTDESIELRPMPALRRLGRRATISELNTLVFLRSTPIKLKTDRPTTTELLTAVDAQLQSQPDPVAIENRTDDPLSAAHLGIAANATLADALEDLSQQTTATWYPWGKTIVILWKREQVRTQLTKTISARYSGVDVSQVVMELLQRADVNFNIDPNAYQHIPAEHRSVRLLLDNATIQQALETIGGYTGLTFEVTDDGVHISNPAAQITPK